MNATIATSLRYALTGTMVAAAGWASLALWRHYDADPWTRDGRVRAEVVQVAPDVAGLVTRVLVGHDQKVHRGDVLFEIDRPRYQLALSEAEASLVRAQASVQRAAAAITRAQANLAQSRREASRNRGLGNLVAAETTEQSETKQADALASLAEARAAQAEAQAQVLLARQARDLAHLNLERTSVRAPIDGQLSDMSLRPGNYVAPGKPVLALVDSASLRVDGYFEETKLPQLHVGQQATIRLMGEAQVLHGHVTSIAGAIEDHDRTGSPNLLPAINPSFSWVRLAQRVPVRIALDRPPAGVALIAGRTATVTLDKGGQK
jgi:RND family efflux transporter MFP subunit